MGICKNFKFEVNKSYDGVMHADKISSILVTCTTTCPIISLNSVQFIRVIETGGRVTFEAGKCSEKAIYKKNFRQQIEEEKVARQQPHHKKVKQL